MKRVRGGSGLGDSIYLRPFVDYWLSVGEQVEVCSNYPDVFIDTRATVSPFRRDRVNKVCHYVSGKARPDTTQWDDLCISAGITVSLKFKWRVKNQDLRNMVRAQAQGRPIVLVHGGRQPMGRSDGFGIELLPEQAAFVCALEVFSDCLLVKIGAGPCLYPIQCEVDLTDKTSVSDLLDLAATCDAVVAQCSFAVPLAEAFRKPLLAVWSARAAKSSHPYIQTITPRKVLSNRTSAFVMDDWSQEQIKGAISAFREF